MKYVITGAPSSGKTSVLKCLEGMGYRVLSESARIVISSLVNNKIVIDERDVRLQRAIFEMQIKREDKLDGEDIVFLDRGLPDSLAYLALAGADISELILSNRLKSYEKVFFLERLQVVDDGLRVTDESQIDNIENKIKAIYIGLGCELINVPVFCCQSIDDSVRERAMFIIGNM